MIARLGHLAVTHWMSLDGYGVAHGIDPKREPLQRFCAYVYYMSTRNADSKSLAKFETQLWMPPKGVAPDPRSPWSPENETRMFKAAQALTSGGASALAVTAAPVPSMRERAQAAKSAAKAAAS